MSTASNYRNGMRLCCRCRETSQHGFCTGFQHAHAVGRHVERDTDERTLTALEQKMLDEHREAVDGD
jgi:hypothetical protein